MSCVDWRCSGLAKCDVFSQGECLLGSERDSVWDLAFFVNLSSLSIHCQFGCELRGVAWFSLFLVVQKLGGCICDSWPSAQEPQGQDAHACDDGQFTCDCISSFHLTCFSFVSLREKSRSMPPTTASSDERVGKKCACAVQRIHTRISLLELSNGFAVTVTVTVIASL